MTAPRPEELQSGLDLGRHAPLSELAPAGQLLELVPGDLLQPSLSPLPERDSRARDVRDDRERVEVELSGHERRGEVLVDDRFHSFEDAVRAPDDGDPAASRYDRDPARPEPRLQETTDGVTLEPADRAGDGTRRRQPPRAPSNVIAHPNLFRNVRASSSV